MEKAIRSFHVQVAGLVQGVGFRPFIYRIAHQHHLCGWVKNTNACVEIVVQGDENNVKQFLKNIRKVAPVAAIIDKVTYTSGSFPSYSSFEIISSSDESEEITEVSPDIAVCEACLDEMDYQPNRVDYPFINCTHCGPRFSIITDLPYDRDKTTMRNFKMCHACQNEYKDVHDRRFHAQPVACSVCGPKYILSVDGRSLQNISEIITMVCRMLESGKIIAIKGSGGFHLACDACDEKSVQRLRYLKNRDGKPFAVMFRNLETVSQYAKLSHIAINSIRSWRRPIVLLSATTKLTVAPGVTSGLSTIGIMLPYLPLHYLLFRELQLPAIVLTSGNFSEEPIIISNDSAKEKFSGLTDAILYNNRDIANRTDDSVVKQINRKETVLRKSRGYAPSPVRVKANVEGILATGAELANCFCIGKGEMAILSQHIGDLKNAETAMFYEETVEKFQRLFRFNPSLIVSDLHPDYFSTRFAGQFEGICPVMKVQHHHAHIASCMAEHRLGEPVIGVAMDGTGYGTDGTIWGAEFLFCDLNDFERYSHFEYLPLPGGDRGVEEPWRMGLSCLYHAFGEDFLNLELPFLKKLEREKTENILKMIRSGINSPLVSSAGRVFDAVAALLDLCSVATFQAEGPMRLESLAICKTSEEYLFEIDKVIRLDLMFREIIENILKGIEKSTISTKFHNTMVAVISEVVARMVKEKGIRKVILSGGSFQNKYLTEGVIKRLKGQGLKVFTHGRIPPNDGGIALGQLMIAAKRRELGMVQVPHPG